MRSLLIALLAFTAGILLTVQWTTGLQSSPPPPSAVRDAGTPPETPQDDIAALPWNDRWPQDAPTPEQVLYAQPRMMREALARLGPRIPGRPNLYLLGFAGDGSEDVFHNEVEYAARLFAQRFDETAHSLVLANHPTTLTTRPLASWSNLETALDGLSRVMHPDEDILLLYITTHGSEDHTLLVDMDPMPLDQIGAGDLADILAMRPFKWKVVVVNACYSGGFVPPLHGPGTLVLTAARADRSSFGCGSDSDITYFGKAWLVDGLNHSGDFIEAFRQAVDEIALWEKQDELPASEPQIDIGSGIAGQLEQWRKSHPPGPAIPFHPATQATP